MNFQDKTKQEYDCNFRDDLIAQRLGEILPTARVKKLGYLICVFMENSTWTIHQVADNTFDVCGKISGDGETSVDEMGIGQDRLELVLLNAFKSESPVAEDRNPLGVDPLGERTRKQGRNLNESGSVQSSSARPIQERFVPRMLYGTELFSYLQEVLPLAESRCRVDAAGNLIVAVDALRVRVIPVGANLYDVETFIGEKREPKQVQISHGETVRYVFDLVSAAQRMSKSPVVADDEGQDVEETDAYEILRELAGELGKPTDIFRNKELVNLRVGLLLEGHNRRGTTKNVLSGMDKHLRQFENLKHQHGETIKPEATPKAKWFRGHPVAVSGEVQGKTLAYVRNVGAVFVDKKDLPATDQLQLSWDPGAGVVMVPKSEQAKRPSWKQSGFGK